MFDSLTVLLFIVALFFAAAGNALYLYVEWKVSGQRIKIFQFRTIHDFMRLLRMYRQHAKSKGWPMWPIFCLLLTAACMFAAVFMLASRVVR